ncbi:uncharacterized protein EV422DRAFT_606970 [Fimicolochytrium jonesii]|uniref:uncharacterized protein n=1 Tax=Fimicolochytrium jonesii TaxID=1396493 RepID=UPI0022FECA49|nr:uncharacterized protein EV422DRAFT_606970 [Fimicolochytrium jonesii]KAI8816933.1 hypothetical protein EV422DRAFT_606970 [Fimicolochytrium jonesii]
MLRELRAPTTEGTTRRLGVDGLDLGTFAAETTGELNSNPLASSLQWWRAGGRGVGEGRSDDGGVGGRLGGGIGGRLGGGVGGGALSGGGDGATALPAADGVGGGNRLNGEGGEVDRRSAQGSHPRGENRCGRGFVGGGGGKHGARFLIPEARQEGESWGDAGWGFGGLDVLLVGGAGEELRKIPVPGRGGTGEDDGGGASGGGGGGGASGGGGGGGASGGGGGGGASGGGGGGGASGGGGGGGASGGGGGGGARGSGGGGLGHFCWDRRPWTLGAAGRWTPVITPRCTPAAIARQEEDGHINRPTAGELSNDAGMGNLLP